jgi:hypothetical protein
LPLGLLAFWFIRVRFTRWRRVDTRAAAAP